MKKMTRVERGWQTLFGAFREDVLVVHFAEPLASAVPLADLSNHESIDVDDWAPLVHARCIYFKTPQRENQRIGPAESVEAAIIPVGTSRVRIHLQPQHFPMADQIDWPGRVVGERNDLLAVVKPAGIPCQPVASNWAVTLSSLVSRALNRDCGPLNRLDLWTGGIVCLSLSPAGARYFHGRMAAGRVKKIYRVLLEAAAGSLVERATPPYSLLHYMPPGANFHLASPRLISTRRLPGWKMCKLTVLKQRPVRAINCRTCKEFDADLQRKISLPGPDARLVDLEVELITGRTHQIRAQFASLGASVVNDSLYKPFASPVDGSLLSSDPTLVYRYSFKSVALDKSAETLDKLSESLPTDSLRSLARRFWTARKNEGPLGLQAHSIEADAEENSEGFSFEAGEPWWNGGRV